MQRILTPFGELIDQCQVAIDHADPDDAQERHIAQVYEQARDRAINTHNYAELMAITARYMNAKREKYMDYTFVPTPEEAQGLFLAMGEMQYPNSANISLEKLLAKLKALGMERHFPDLPKLSGTALAAELQKVRQLHTNVGEIGSPHLDKFNELSFIALSLEKRVITEDAREYKGGTPASTRAKSKETVVQPNNESQIPMDVAVESILEKELASTTKDTVRLSQPAYDAIDAFLVDSPQTPTVYLATTLEEIRKIRDLIRANATAGDEAYFIENAAKQYLATQPMLRQRLEEQSNRENARLLRRTGKNELGMGIKTPPERLFALFITKLDKQLS